MAIKWTSGVIIYKYIDTIIILVLYRDCGYMYFLFPIQMYNFTANFIKYVEVNSLKFIPHNYNYSRIFIVYLCYCTLE